MNWKGCATAWTKLTFSKIAVNSPCFTFEPEETKGVEGAVNGGQEREINQEDYQMAARTAGK
jgi:hypothetical protein